MNDFVGKEITIVTGEPWDFSDYNDGRAEIFGNIKEKYIHNKISYYRCETNEFFIYKRKYGALLVSSRHKDLIIENFYKNGIATINGTCLNDELKAMLISRGQVNFGEIDKYITENLAQLDGIIGSIRKIE